MQDPVSESQNNNHESSIWKELFDEALSEFLPNIFMGVVRNIVHG